MDKETLMIKYAPVILIVFIMFFQYNLFVTPQELEKHHREIIREINEEYVPKEQYNSQYTDLKKKIDTMQDKIDKIYDAIMAERKHL